MNIFDDYTYQLLKKLNQLKVEYLVVGGYAVNYHGYRRTTGDIDLWIKPDNGLNKDRIVKALKSLGVDGDKLQQLIQLDFSRPLVFIDGEEPFKIDFMTAVSGVKFDEAWKQKVISHLDGSTLPPSLSLPPRFLSAGNHFNLPLNSPPEGNNQAGHAYAGSIPYQLQQLFFKAGLWQEVPLQVGRKRNGCIEAGGAHYGGIELLKAMLCDHSGKLASYSAC